MIEEVMIKPDDMITDAEFNILNKALSRIEKETGWISVGERFPEDNTMILWYTDFIVWVNLWWATECWEWKWDWWIKYTHWMPLPLPPNQ